MSDVRIDIPLSVPVIGERERQYVDECLATGWLSTGGSFITRFEDAVRNLTGARHAIACQSGTAALHVALRLAGVGPGDEVIVPTLTFIATINPISYLGARPVFIGCDEHMNMDPAVLAEFLESRCERADVVTNKITGRRVAAIMPVHVFGNPCDLESLSAIATQWGLPLIEDAAESLGSSWTAGSLAGRQTGTVGLLGCLSFNGNKIITTGGGGMILTDDDELAVHARHLTTQAKTDSVRFIHDEVGYNYRMTNVQAAIGVGQIESLSARIEGKSRNHRLYAELLADVDGIDLLGVPTGTSPNYWFYSAIVRAGVFGLDRDGLMAGLDNLGIQTRPVWYLNHLQAPYRDCLTVGVEPAVWYWERVLNLPCSSNLSSRDVHRVCEAIRSLARS